MSRNVPPQLPHQQQTPSSSSAEPPTGPNVQTRKPWFATPPTRPSPYEQPAWAPRARPWVAAGAVFCIILGGTLAGAAGREKYQAWNKSREGAQRSRLEGDGRISSVGDEALLGTGQAADLNTTSMDALQKAGSGADRQKELESIQQTVRALESRKQELLRSRGAIWDKRERIRERMRRTEEEQRQKAEQTAAEEQVQVPR